MAVLAAGLSSLPLSGLKASAETAELDLNCKAAYTCDFDTQTTVYAKNDEARLPIASMCKIMTLLLSFEEIEAGRMTYDEQICASEHASSMGGSQVFLDTGLNYRVEELMKSVAVCSANDSCVALSERVAGSEEQFVSKMNERAAALGAKNTLFANCTGLPKDPQYSCAKDVALMLRALLRHEKYLEFCAVRLEDFAHPDGRTIQMTNTNKLIQAYQGCDGGKTGFTNEAGFCLAATAKRGDMRVISVVIGADGSKERFKGVSDCFNYCFDHYENKIVLKAGEAIEERIKVTGSKTKETELISKENLCVFQKKGGDNEYRVEYELPNHVKAPVGAGENVGFATLFVDGTEVKRTELLSSCDIQPYTYWEAVREGAQNWN